MFHDKMIKQFYSAGLQILIKCLSVIIFIVIIEGSYVSVRYKYKYIMQLDLEQGRIHGISIIMT